jgi:2-alkyl-3-oxoalkanoate reductase
VKLALTGVTSGVGLRLAEVLRDGGHEVSGLVRSPERADARRLAAQGVRLVVGSLDESSALDDLARGADVFVHLAAHVGDTGPASEFVRVNVGGTRAAVSAASRAGVKRFVHLSSTAVYGRPDEGRIDESWPTKHSELPYEDTKTDAERVAFRLGASAGLEVVAIRPPGIYGPHDRNFMPRAVRALRKRQFVFIEGGAAPFNLVWVDHVVDVIILAAEKEGIAGEAFNVVDEVDADPPTVREVATTIAEAVGAPKPAISIPYPVALLLSHAIEKGSAVLRVENVPPFTPFIVEMLTRRVVFDATKAVRCLGWRPRKRALEGLREEAIAYASRSRSTEIEQGDREVGRK